MGNRPLISDIYVKLSSDPQDLRNCDGSEIGTAIVVEASSIRVMYNYPLSSPVIFNEISPNGINFTREDLVGAIVKRYHEIYTEEEKSKTFTPIRPTVLQSGAIFMNRPETDGKYGIWGHDLEDLILTEISYDGDVCHLLIDS
jgi:hypothetical protein